MKEELDLKLKGIKNKIPVLILGNYVDVFLNTYTGIVHNINSIEDKKQFINNYNGKVAIINLGSIELIKNLSSIKKVIVLCKNPKNISLDELLGFNYIISNSNQSQKCTLMSTSEAIDKLNTTEDKIDMPSFYANISPTYKYDKRLCYKKSNKILNLLGGLYENK